MSGCGDLDALRHALNARLETLACDLLGPPNRHTLRRSEWRWGRKDSRSLVVRGPKRGSYKNHESGQRGGGALDLIMDARNCNVADAIRYAKEWTGLDTADLPRPRLASVTPLPVRDLEAEAREEAARASLGLRLFDEAVPVADALILRTYLGWRGIRRADIARHFEGVDTFFADLRFHPETPRGAGEKLPAMIALVRDIRTLEPCGVQRTFLAPDGRGKVAHGSPKMALGRIRDAAIMLMRPCDEVTHGLGLAEGVETGLSCLARGWAPIWVTCGTAGMAAFPVLPGIETLTIYADNSPSGIDAAQTCARRWITPQAADAENWSAVDAWLDINPVPSALRSPAEVEIVVPREGEDWNDAIRGAAA